ncbi:MAG: RpiB/LacA/LacB family sugar-phosphate isomerase [Fimbriimonadaceae bacterium]|nr:RpiB/LacA/LacB family sugar-phosphate isomerase [Fimbriimonadaceae bacterium]QYK55740.1 MAG: RpiB/LacA/LacB family sugar-phosphate isomerase [Fimbriimonadaceae bacterium]
MKLVVGGDHAAVALLDQLAAELAEGGHEVVRVGAVSPESFDYPIAADEVAEAVLKRGAEMGILACGTGIGVCIRANRHPGIRAAQACTIAEAKLARAHNHANVICLGARTTTPEKALELVQAFLSGPEDHAERHLRRVSQLDGPVE